MPNPSIRQKRRGNMGPPQRVPTVEPEIGNKCYGTFKWQQGKYVQIMYLGKYLGSRIDRYRFGTEQADIYMFEKGNIDHIDNVNEVPCKSSNNAAQNKKPEAAAAPAAAPVAAAPAAAPAATAPAATAPAAAPAATAPAAAAPAAAPAAVAKPAWQTKPAWMLKLLEKAGGALRILNRTKATRKSKYRKNRRRNNRRRTNRK